MVEKMRELSCIDDRSILVTIHHGDNGGATHEQLENYFAGSGIRVGFDGMIIDF